MVQCNQESQEARTFGRMIQSIIDEAEAINCYEQHLAFEPNCDQRQKILSAQSEEFRRFLIDLNFILCMKPDWREALGGLLSEEDVSPLMAQTA